MPTPSAASPPETVSPAPGALHQAVQRMTGETFHRQRTGESFWVWLLVRKRVLVSLAAFITLVLLDLWLLPVVPRDVLAWRDPWTCAALVTLALGLAIRSWAAGTLHKNRQLTRTGPYALVRNPLYVGSFLMMLAFCLLLNDGWSLALVAGPMTLIYWFSVSSEERLLAREFPADWQDYALTTPRFVPYRPRWPNFAGWSFAQWRKNHEHQAVLASLAGLAGLWAWRAYGI